jgi:hypothetical protein
VRRQGERRAPDVVTPGAALRVGIGSTTPGLVLRFHCSAAAIGYGSFSAAEIDAIVATDGIYWSPCSKATPPRSNWRPGGADFGDVFFCRRSRTSWLRATT